MTAHPTLVEGSTLRPREPAEDSGTDQLNTNDNPYPPSPRCLKAVQAAVDGRLLAVS